MKAITVASQGKEDRRMISKILLSMGMLRLLSGSIEILAAILILRANQIEKALLINSGLALVGPFILLMTTTIGLVGVAEKLSFSKMVWLLVGVSCIFIGILKK